MIDNFEQLTVLVNDFSLYFKISALAIIFFAGYDDLKTREIRDCWWNIFLIVQLPRIITLLPELWMIIGAISVFLFVAGIARLFGGGDLKMFHVIALAFPMQFPFALMFAFLFAVGYGIAQMRIKRLGEIPLMSMFSGSMLAVMIGEWLMEHGVFTI